MVTVNPIPITDDIKLSFWCWYNIEVDYDYAFVEVSKDGRLFDVLDKFTGSSGGWEFKEYSLEDYINESVFIRIRYITDDYTQEEGFYIDDISPIAEFGTIETLSDTITENSYDITNKSQGRYFYQVRGYNSAHEWGDFSTIEDIIVYFAGAPDTPEIDGPTEGKPSAIYNFSIISTDPEGNDVLYYVDWGDGQVEDWIGPYLSGEEVVISHSWIKQNKYIIQVKAKDINGEESGWGTHEINIPRTRFITMFNLQNLIERFLDLFPIFYRFIFNK
ncbi:hypothetical protein AYK21_02095 [Thermoplasmatales archaeon SG8-52-2]|nr:MAG: hypothetical protein AYK21_02095 [Thermoplasmatales archaeon SG8-52-2]